MSRADSATQLREAFDEAAHFGARSWPKQFVSGPEYTVAILGDRALPSIRIDVSGEFYDFDAKYRSHETLFSCPSDLNPARSLRWRSGVERISHHRWRSLGSRRCYARCRWRLAVLEVNTVPGMTSHSLVPMAQRPWACPSLNY
ncbi:MAG: hypothetical protein CM15mP74_01510 [Halieaceae bacterium]|nr:MAG: hypothetical protein CM15mP74_01510 [Halieaceae bacterium]